MRQEGNADEQVTDKDAQGATGIHGDNELEQKEGKLGLFPIRTWLTFHSLHVFHNKMDTHMFHLLPLVSSSHRGYSSIASHIGESYSTTQFIVNGLPARQFRK